jgi:hypothetical protein
MQATQATAKDGAPAQPSAVVMPERPAPPRMPSAELRIRVKTSPALRRLVPTRLAVKRATRRAAETWKHDASARADAIAATQTIIAGTPRADEIDEIARGHLIEDEAQRAMFWQPWVTPIRDPLSTERMLEALTDTRGVLLCPSHTGPYAGTPELFMETLGHELLLTGGPWFFDEPTPDLWGRRLARWRKGSKAPIINSKGSFQFLADLLKQGACVHLFFDMPGPHSTHFLGKPVMLANGAARLAVQADARILPLRSIRAGHHKRVEVGAPLDPRELTGVDDLHDALAAQHERWILERPAEMTDPRSFGWAATPTGWDRPQRADEQGRPTRS